MDSLVTSEVQLDAETAPDAPRFRQSLAAKISALKTRETICLQIRVLPFVSHDRREAFAWLRERNCYVKYVHKRQALELRKM
jgi:hypothetical protein